MLDWLGLDDDDDGDDGRDYRRTLGIRDKQILYRNAKGRCQNPGCNRKIDFDEMQVGHKTAWSKRGSTTLSNSACLCYRCNKLQGTDSWVTFLKKQGMEDPKAKEIKSVKQSMEALTLSQLKSLAREHHVEVRGETVEDWFTSRTIAPSKSKYVRKLSKILTKEQLISVPKEAPKTVKKAVKKKRRTKSKDSWLMSLQRVVKAL
jgi:phage FluMu protein Com